MNSHEQKRKLVGANIRRARQASGLSINKLAKQLGIPRDQLSKWENGVHEPSWGYLGQIAVALRVTRSSFYEDPPPTGKGAR